MAHTSSAKKKIKQYANQRARNNAAKSLVKTNSRKLSTQVAAKDDAGIKAAFAELCSSLDKAVKKGNMKKETAIRRKTRAANKLRATLSA